MLQRTLSLLLIALISRTAFAENEDNVPSPPLRLRVLTYNVWGVPWITPLRTERIARIPKAIAELAPDLVAIEEAWADEDAAVLMAGLAQAGLPHQARHAPEWPNQNGLIIASRFPIHDSRFRAFTQGRRPHLLWHVDYLAAKGVAQVKIDTPLGPINFAATHLQATYGSKDYLFVQMSQALEAADELDDRAHPTIFAGDVNSPYDGLPAQLLAGRGDLTPCDPKSGIDQILYRDGTFVRVRTVSVKQVLTESYDLGSDTIPLSDHPGILADIELSSCEGRCEAPATSAHFEKLEAEVLPLIDLELSTRSFNRARDTILASVLPISGILMIAWRRRALGRSCRKSRAFAAVMIVFSLWFGYLCISFGPAHVSGVLGIKGRLAKAASTPTPPILSRSGS